MTFAPATLALGNNISHNEELECGLSMGFWFKVRTTVGIGVRINISVMLLEQLLLEQMSLNQLSTMTQGAVALEQ